MGGSKARDVKENIVMLCPTHHREAHGASTPGPDGAMGTASGAAGMLQRTPPSIPVSSGLGAGVSPELAIDAGTDERGTREQTVQGLRPSVAPKCWTLAELRDEVAGWMETQPGEGYEGAEEALAVVDFLNFLGGKEPV